MQGNDINDWKEKTVGIGTDGASFNTGRENGVVVQLQREIPWLIGFWCISHNFERGLLKAIKARKFMSDITDLLQSVYKHYHYSPKACRELKLVAAAMEENVLQPVNILGTRWAPHLYRALMVLLKNFRPLVAHFSHTAQARDASVTMVGRCKAITKSLKDYKLILYMHFMLDILQHAATLSLQFQKDQCTPSSASDAIFVFTTAMEGLKHNDGENVESFLNNSEDGSWKDQQLNRGENCIANFHNAKDGILADVIKYVSDRFEIFENNQIMVAGRILDPSEWPVNAPQADVAAYGNDELTALSEHFNQPLQRSNFTIQGARREWLDLKVFALRHHNRMNFLPFWKYIFQNHKDRFFNVCLLAEIIMCFPINTACCERGFSVMKKVKSDWRSRLEPETLDTLMRIAIEGKPLEQFDPEPAMRLWNESGVRRRRPNFMQDESA